MTSCIRSAGGRRTRPRGRSVRARRFLLAAVVCSVVAADLSLAGSAGAASWTLESFPQATVPTGALSAVSCTSTKACTAVGSYAQGSGSLSSVPLAERWDGSSWVVQPAPLPNPYYEGEGSGLTGVSCSSASSCMAVGSAGWSDEGCCAGRAALIEGWSRGRWTILVNTGAEVDDPLAGVSCPSKRFCMAVGSFTPNSSGPSSSVPYVERWNGGSWSGRELPKPRDFSSAQLNAVSCISARACVAVGTLYGGPGAGEPLVELWSGRRWSVERFGRHGRPPGSELDAVSCASAHVCMTLGTTSKGVPVAAHWNGSSWSPSRLATPAGLKVSGGAGGLSCASTRACTTVGTVVGRGPVAEGWNGRRWSLQTIPLPAAGVGAVSCPSARACLAVGATDQGGGVGSTAAQSNRGRWASVNVPQITVPAQTDLSSVSCPSAMTCLAVGWFGDAFGSNIYAPLAEIWNGTTWTDQSIPSLFPIGEATLTSISCPSATYCMAVGQSSYGLVSVDWNGTNWRVENIPSGSTNQAALAALELTDVSCGSPTFCVAIGPGKLSAFWNGTSWTVNSILGAATGVSCVSSTFCVAIATSAGNSIAEVWNGAHWATEPMPAIPANAIGLVGVSCATPSSCMAVGAGPYPSGSMTELWNGATWTIEPTPSPPGGVLYLRSVSCTSATSTTDCIAVGESFAVFWDGTNWTLQTTPYSPASLGAVSCSSAAACTAVGTGSDGSVAERYG